ncbi:MAG: hypothetical protein NT125_08400 [Candidatus Bipolaricaulota bacterium]|nr:hypothetical protein [Candidatus Bipolaricaulota bacterium]
MTAGLWVLAAIFAVALALIFVRDRMCRASEATELVRSMRKEILEDVHRTEIQQFLANCMSVLRYVAASRTADAPLPVPRHSFPRAVSLARDGSSPSPLRFEDLRAAIFSSNKTHRCASERMMRDIAAQMRNYIDSRYLPAIAIEQRESMGVRLRRAERELEFLRHDCALHEDDLSEVLKGEGLEVRFIRGLEVLSLLLERPSDSEGSHFVVLVRDDVHPVVKAFALAHELSHWFLHVRTPSTKGTLASNFYLHSLPLDRRWTLLEEEADALAITMMLPTAYLADCEWRGKLDVGHLLSVYTEPYDEMPSGRARHELEALLEMRIERYRSFKSEFLDLSLPDRPITDGSQLNAIVEWLADDYCWAVLDAGNRVVRCSALYADEVFDSSAEDVMRRRPSVLEDLTPPAHRAKTEEVLRHRAQARKPMLYFNWLEHGTSGKRFFGVYGFPVVDANGTYSGSLSILKPF